MPDCTVCRTPDYEGVRIGWGCDAPARDVVFKTTCSTCGGSGCGPDPEWEWPEPRCVDGLREHYRCMNATLQTSPSAGSVRMFMDAYQAFDANGVLPVAGGLLDQTPHFVQGIRVAASERAQWEKIRTDHYRAKAKAGT